MYVEFRGILGSNFFFFFFFVFLHVTHKYRGYSGGLFGRGLLSALAEDKRVQFRRQEDTLEGT